MTSSIPPMSFKRMFLGGSRGSAGFCRLLDSPSLAGCRSLHFRGAGDGGGAPGSFEGVGGISGAGLGVATGGVLVDHIPTTRLFTTFAPCKGRGNKGS